MSHDILRLALRRFVNLIDKAPEGPRWVTLHLLFCLYKRQLIRKSLKQHANRFMMAPVWFALRSAIRTFPRRGVYYLHSPDAAFPVRLRLGTSDLDVFRQIFVEREYAFLDCLSDVRNVVDCGANVGYSSIWFLSRHSDVRVIAVEPDPDNLIELRSNLAPFGNRAAVLGTAVWSHCTNLRIVRGENGDNRHWATHVRECAATEEGDLTAIDMPIIFERFSGAQIDVLKVDIEGAELQVFSSTKRDWIDRVRSIAVEVHGREQLAAVETALPESRFGRYWSGELCGYIRREV